MVEPRGPTGVGGAIPGLVRSSEGTVLLPKELLTGEAALSATRHDPEWRWFGGRVLWRKVSDVKTNEEEEKGLRLHMAPNEDTDGKECWAEVAGGCDRIAGGCCADHYD